MRPAPFWSWNDKLDEAELRRQIREMADKGWGSFFMHSRVGLVTGYLSKEWFELVNACADEAEKTGTYAWLYDEDKWPSGFAGGEVPEKDEAFRARALLAIPKGKKTANDTVLAEFSHNGEDLEICRRVSPLGHVWYNGTCYVDLMSPDAVKEFINCTHERYKEHCGQHFGKSIPGIFTDEPCYLHRFTYEWSVVPWSDFLPGFFKEMKGYDILEKLPQIFYDVEDYRKVRFDFYDAATELFKRSFFKQYYDWCDTNGLIMTGHTMIEDSLVCQTEWCGDAMSLYEYMHWPGIDKLGRNVDPTNLTTCKQLSSAVDQLGKPRAFCEVFGCVGGQVSFFHRKWIGDWQAALGISFVNHHLSLYSMRGERKRDYPANLFYQQPWWDDERGFADYEARVCATVAEGERLVDILVFQPISSVWAEYTPIGAATQTIEANYDGPFRHMSTRLAAEKLDFHYGNENLMAKFGSVEGDKMKVGKQAYQCVIIPPAINIKSSTLKLFQEFINNGGKLIVVGAVPKLVDGVEAHVELPGAVIASSVDEAVTMASAMFANRTIVTDKYTGGNAGSVFIHSRKVGGSVRHFFVNTDEIRPVRATVKMPEYANEAITVMDLYDGSLYKLSAENGTFDVSFAPAGSLLVITGDEAKDATEALPAVLGSGVCLKDLDTLVPVSVMNDFDCRVLEDNVLLLNDFVLELDGKIVHEGPVCASWHTHFYKAKDGTPFKATYSFLSDIELKDAFAAIEVAENLDSITFNGQLVQAAKSAGELGALDPEKNWKDISFTKVPLPAIKKGINTLIIEGKKVNNITDPGCHVRVANWREHEATEAEEAYIVGRFSLAPVSEGRYMITDLKEPAGKNLTTEGFPFYCGRTQLSTAFDLQDKPAGKVYLKLSGAQLASAVVRINGTDCGTLRWKPFMVDITDAVKQGENKLEIEMATTLVNAFGPNRRKGIKDMTGIGAGEFIDMSRFKRSYEFFEFGIESAVVYVIE